MNCLYLSALWTELSDLAQVTNIWANLILPESIFDFFDLRYD